MKLKLNRNLRKILIFIFTICALLLSYLIYNEIYNPGYQEQKNAAYTYNNNASINYSVYLKPNKLYDKNVLEEGKLYITEFVDYLDANLKYEFSGEKADNIKANYSIIVKIKGFNVEPDEIKNIWEKDFPVVADKTVNSYGDKILINESVKLILNDYNTFAKEIMEASKINCLINLSLLMNVNLSGATDKGTVEDSIITSLIIPLDVSMFEISGNNVVDKPGVIEEIVQVQMPLNKIPVAVFGLIIAVLSAALIVLVFFTQIAPEKDQHEKELNKIFKKHGDRLVALNSNINIKEPITVKSMDDLVKIADEAGKPILYKYSNNYKEINKFYVANNDEVFILFLTYSDIIKQAEDKIKMPENEQNRLKRNPG